jgi:hypothetical protein
LAPFVGLDATDKSVEVGAKVLLVLPIVLAQVVACRAKELFAPEIALEIRAVVDAPGKTVP